MRVGSEAGQLIGMTGWLAMQDLEEGCRTLLGLGFEAVGIYHTQVASRLIGAPTYDAHFAAAGACVRDMGLGVSTLNVIEDDPVLDPLTGDPDAAAERLAIHLRHAAAMGAPGILIWDGRATDSKQADPSALARTIDRARAGAGSLAGALRVSVELHPFTFALKYGRLEELAAALPKVGASICMDFCHFAVAMGQDFIRNLSDDVLAAIGEIHYCDSDAQTSEFHFPPGKGILDLEEIETRLAARGIPAALDLFQWPFPQSAAVESMDYYRRFVQAQA